jgi:uncharacterized protein (DUF1330 family)
MSAYVFAFIDVQDPERYKEYAARVPPTIAAFGGTYVVRNGAKHPLEGNMPDRRAVLLKFPSVAQAKAWYESDAYKECRAIRTSASTGDIFIVEGWEGAS